LDQSNEERGHAQKLIEYQNDRGGKVDLLPLKAPPRQEWASLLDIFKEALELEKTNNKALLDLHGIASEKSDPDVSF
jgi:ferritin heavy chain